MGCQDLIIGSVLYEQVWLLGVVGAVLGIWIRIPALFLQIDHHQRDEPVGLALDEFGDVEPVRLG